MSIFVTRLNELRGSSSVSAFARRAEIPQPSMDKYLKGRLPSIEILIRLACRFGVTSDWLLGLTDERTPGAGTSSDARIEVLEKKILRLEGENEGLRSALEAIGGRHVQPAKTGGAFAAKIA